MNWQNIKNSICNWFVTVILIICGICAIFGIVLSCDKHIRQTTLPVEECIIDSVKYENDKLVIEITNLDSIKNAKVIEIKTLDNDSTLKLFYELIRK